MATVGKKQLVYGSLAPGATATWWWNNPPPGNVWMFSVSPDCISDYYGVQSWHVEAEVTQVKHVTHIPDAKTQARKSRIEVTVKNVGPHKMNYSLDLAWVA